VIVWDDHGHAPSLTTEANWISAGEIVFDAAIVYDGITTASDVRKPEWYSKTGVLLSRDGAMPFYRYVIRQKGKVELGRLACSACHTRVMADGTTVKGAQGNFYLTAPGPMRSGQADSNRRRSMLLKGACLRRPGCGRIPIARLAQMSVDQISAAHDDIPPGVAARHRSSFFYPVQVPDLIGVRDRQYSIAPVSSSIDRLWT